MIRSEYVSNHIKNKKKIKYSYIVIKKRAHLLVEILMKEGIKQFLDEMQDKNINLVVLRTLDDISNNPIEREAFLTVMNDNGVGIYLFEEGCFAMVNYNFE